MKKFVLAAMVVCGVLAFGAQAHALSITPGSPSLVASGDQTGQSQISVAIDGLIGSATELYKQNVGGSEEGLLAANYITVFSNTPSDPSGATITYTGGPFIGDPQYLLVKDGSVNGHPGLPVWYLFDLTSAWDGMDTLQLSGFWPAGGAISHVTLYGTTSVPEPGTMSLLGAGLFGLGLFGRKRTKA